MKIPRLSLFLAMLALLGGLAVPLDAQQSTVSGVVIDETTNRPVQGARVQVIGTTLNGITDGEGRYSIRNVSPGQRELRLVMVGYASATRSVTVLAGQTVQADWQIAPAAFTLDEVVVTAVGEQFTRELGNAVSRIETSELVETAPVSSLAEVLGGGRVASVTVLANEGTPGAGARVRIRGLSSASLSNDPLLYVDGIRVTERGAALGPYVGGGSPSFLNDLNPEEIESIEIVKGPSAATLYGTQAANGVIRVTTKKGRAGPPRWNVYGEYGAVSDPTDYPAVYFSRATGGGTCLPWQQAGGSCTIDQLFVRDLTEEPDYTFMKTAIRQQYGAQVSGGSDQARYFFSAEWEETTGNIVMPETEKEFIVEDRGLQSVSDIPENQLNPSGQQKVNVRANVGAGLGSRADVDVSVGFVSNNTLIPQTGDNLEGVIGAALFGTADPDASLPWGFARPAYGLSNTTYRKSDHFTPSARLHYAPADWLSVRAIAGLDYLGFRDENLVRNGEACPFCGTDQGARILDRYTTHKYSAELGGTATLKLSERLGSKTAVGAQYTRDITRVSFNTGTELPPGAETFSGAAVITSSEQTTEFRTLGTYIEQQFSWDDRLFVTGAIRVDQNSAFGEDNRTAAYPKVAFSWVALESEGSGLLNQMRLRGAYGQSGQQPTLLAAQTYFTPINSAVFAQGLVPAVTLGGLGNTGVKPERSAEFEGGFDAAFLSNRVNLEVTYYSKRTTDALVQRELPGSVGAVQFRLENIGVVTNRGIEVSFLARTIDSRAISWDLGAEFSTNRNRLEELAPGVPPLTGFGFRNAPGYPLFGQWWPGLLSYDDANSDGIIDPSEVVVSDTAIFLGNTVPTKTLGISSEFGFFENRLRLTTVLDYKSGYVSHNINGLFQCAFIQNCRELNDPNATLEEQAKAVAGPRAFGAWAEDGTHMRLREMSLSYTLPGSWLAPLSISNASVTLTGRNLALWTKEFTSWDPELLTQAGTSGDAAPYNFVQQAQPRTFIMRVNLGF